MRYLYVLFIVFVSACGGEIGYKNGFSVPAEYRQEVKPNTQTSSGIRVDTSGYKIDLDTLDKRISQIETCILQIMEENPSPLPEWQCIPENYRHESLKRDTLIIKLVAPVYSKCSNWQMLPIPAPNELCKAKDITPTAECPCLWRTAIQDEDVILTPPPESRPNIPPTNPPAPYLWEIGRMMTSCNGVWFSPFSKCLSY